jgi:hypothetical protein
MTLTRNPLCADDLGGRWPADDLHKNSSSPSLENDTRSQHPIRLDGD